MYQMPIKAIKKILGQEILGHKDNIFNCMSRNYFSDCQKEMVHIGYDKIMEMLNSSETYDDLQSVLDYAGYRMSLQEWIDSL